MPCCAPGGAACPEKPCWGGKEGDGRRWHSLAHAWGQLQSLGDIPKALGMAQGARGRDPALTCRWLCHSPGAEELQKGSREVLGGGRGVHGGLGTGPPPATRAAVTPHSLPSQPQRVQGLGTGDGFGALHPPGDALPLGDSATAGGDSPGGGAATFSSQRQIVLEAGAAAPAACERARP